MFVYANGDSFTAGDELASEILPGFPGNTPYTDLSTAANFKWLDSVYRSHPDIIPVYFKESRRRAYPQKIGDSLKCEVFNNAQGGASMEYIVRTSILDLLNLKNTHKDIVALIGTTQPSRIDLPLPNNRWQSVQIGHKFPDEIPIVFNKYYLRNYTDYHALTNYYKNLIHIQDFCKVNNIRLIFVNVMNDPVVAPEDNIEVTRLKSYVKDYDFDMGEIARQTVQGDVLAPCGHFTEIVHNKLAEEIAKTL